MTKKKKKEEILDLQIFLTRSPGNEVFKYEKLPSFFISSEGRRTRDVASKSDIKEEQQTQAQRIYIAVANSSIVESIKFPFSPEKITEMINNLDCNQTRLVECMDFGTELFNCFIHGSIRDLFRSLSNRSKTLRLTIATSIPELAILPWELMCDTKSDSYPRFISFQPNIRFCRALNIFDRANFELKKSLGDNNKVRILLVTSSPKSLPFINLIKEENLLKFLVDEPPALSNIIELEVIHNANTNNLREKLINFQPHILHLSCHGGYDSKEKLGFVALESPNNPGEADYVNSYRLTSIILEAESVQLAFISTCYGAVIENLSSAFSGVAQLLHAGGINDVIGLTYRILDKTGHAILVNFYRYLLRYGLTVEESISKVRKFLFINGYRLSESFGLTLYQGNASFSLYRDGFEQIPTDDSAEFDKTVKDFEASIASKRILHQRLAEILNLEETKKALQELELSNMETFLAIKVFGDLEIAVEILKEIEYIGIDKICFFEIAEIAKRLSLSANEKTPIETAFVLQMKKKEQDFYEESKKYVVREFSNSFFDKTMKEIIQDASAVNGQDKTFISLPNESKQGEYETFVLNLSKIKSEESNNIGDLLNPKWNILCSLVRKISGVAFVLPGNQKVKLIIKGEQISEFSNGEWRAANFKQFYETIQQISDKLNIDKNLLIDILKKCIYASEDKRRGLIFIIQRKDDLIKKCDPYDEAHQDLKEKTIQEFQSEEYLGGTGNIDGAIILSENGYTIAIGAKLKPESNTKVDGIPGTGLRHLNTQKITKETDSIAFVVSDDGPITIFSKGDVIFRTP